MSTNDFGNLSVLVGAFWLFLHLCYTFLSMTLHCHQKPPPGPIGLPLIGHLHMLGKLPHRSLFKLSQKYGPIMSLHLGSIPTIVVSSPAAAELFLKTNDVIFANRPKSQAADHLWYGTKAIVHTEYGAYWRSVRKFCTLELLSTTNIDSFAGLRRRELGLLIESLKKAAEAGEVVDVSEKVAHLAVDMTCRMLFGKAICDRLDLCETIHEMAGILGAFNVADYIPFLRALDLQGLTRRLKVASKAVDKILEPIIDDHQQDATNGYEKVNKDFVDAILSLENNPTGTHQHLAQNIGRSNIKAIVFEMIFATIDTSKIAIEWIMSELIRHPRVMKVLQHEIKNVTVGGEFVKESQLSKLNYLDMVIKESMRLHPVAPLLVPHESMEDIVIDGYYIQKKSRIIINNWSIGRDPQIWSGNVEEFLPERFLSSNIDLRGKSFELIPFGSGRRGCPGIHLGLINMKLVVAQLVHSFDWELPFGLSADKLDMNETFGLTMPRAKNLLAAPSLRR